MQLYHSLFYPWPCFLLPTLFTSSNSLVVPPLLHVVKLLLPTSCSMTCSLLCLRISITTFGIYSSSLPSNSYVKKELLELMYQSLVLPYCSLVRGNHNQTLKGKLLKLQNWAARVITRDSYDVHSKDVLSKLGWKNLDEQRIKQMRSYVSSKEPTSSRIST